MRPVIALFTVFLLLMGIVVWWSQPAPAADLVVAYTSIGTLDPTRMQASADIRVGYAMSEGLTTFEPHTFQIIPGAAERWSISDDGLTYTFDLRADARWSNGEPVTASDFAETWRQSMLPDFAGPYHSFLTHIRGAQAYFDWGVESLEQAGAEAQRLMAEQGLSRREARQAAGQRRAARVAPKFDELVGVRVVNERRLVVELVRSTPYFIEIAACWPLFPLHQSVRDGADVSAATLMLRRSGAWLRDGHTITNGPYALRRWRFKRYIYLEANPHYWAADPQMPQRLLLAAYADAQTAYHAYSRGQIDLYIGLVVDFLPDLIAAAESGRRDDIHPVDNWGTYYYGYNCRPRLSDGSPNPFADPRVRRAFTLVVDRQAIVRDVTRLRQTVAHTFIPPNSIVGYESPNGLDTIGDAADAADRRRIETEARELLAEAGYGPDRPLPEVDFVYNTGGGHEPTAEAIAAMWTDRLGVKVRMRGEEWGVFMTTRNQGNFMIARQGWFGDYGDPTTFLDLFQSENSNNDTGFNHAEYDRLLAEATDERDPARRMDLLRQAEAIVVGPASPILPLYHYRQVHLYDPAKLSGVTHHARGLQMYHLMRIER